MKQVPARNGGTLTRPDKGETANPNGRPRKLVSDVIKELDNQGIKPVTKQEIQDVYMRLINLEMPDLEAKVKDSKQPALVRIVGKAILSGKGYEVVERMLDRSIGKPDTKTDITTNNKDINTNITLTDEQLKYVIESITPDD
jgi:hypothetical protein